MSDTVVERAGFLPNLNERLRRRPVSRFRQGKNRLSRKWPEKSSRPLAKPVRSTSPTPTMTRRAVGNPRTHGDGATGSGCARLLPFQDQVGGEGVFPGEDR